MFIMENRVPRKKQPRRSVNPEFGDVSNTQVP
jgi:hypothetical protein